MKQEQYQGKKYYTAVLAQYLLSPPKAGTIDITSGYYEIAISKKQKGHKTDDFFGKEKYISDTSKVGNPTVSIAVLPLPGNIADSSASVTGHVDTPMSVTASSENLENKTTEEAKEISTQRYLSEKNRKIFFYTALVLLILLIIIYSIKFSSQNKEECARTEQGYGTETKYRFDWHLPYIIGILLLICCLAVLWK